jgi:hypothetical protein
MPQILLQGETSEVERGTHANVRSGMTPVTTRATLVAVMDTFDPAQAGRVIGVVSSLWPFDVEAVVDVVGVERDLVRGRRELRDGRDREHARAHVELDRWLMWRLRGRRCPPRARR